jgi:hypothetical protein
LKGGKFQINPPLQKYIGHPDTQSSVEIIGAAANGFESGFSGFTGLTITSLDAREDYYYMVHPFPGFPPMHYASAKRRVKSNPLQITNTSKTKT